MPVSILEYEQTAAPPGGNLACGREFTTLEPTRQSIKPTTSPAVLWALSKATRSIYPATRQMIRSCSTSTTSWKLRIPTVRLPITRICKTHSASTAIPPMEIGFLLATNNSATTTIRGLGQFTELADEFDTPVSGYQDSRTEAIEPTNFSIRLLRSSGDKLGSTSRRWPDARRAFAIRVQYERRFPDWGSNARRDRIARRLG